MARSEKSLGKLVAQLLRGAWRRIPPELDISQDELNQVSPLLLASGGAALGWWRVRNSTLRETPATLELQQAYRLHSLQSAIHESDIKDLVTLARDAGAEPVLVKGWAAARLYPEMGLRPYGDVDLCFSREDYPKAKSVLESPRESKYQVDLHEGFLEAG